MAPGYVIGLTGNIASGKSTVARILAQWGADVIDADEAAHESLGPGTEETAAVARRFGAGFVQSDGSVHRAALAGVVFKDPRALADLEAIVHPAARRRILQRLAESRGDVAVIEAIKLLEGPLAHHVDVVWVVTAPRALRVQRLAERGLSAEEASERVDTQNPEDEKMQQANVVLRNDGSLESLRQQVETAWKTLLKESARAHGSRG